MKGRYFLDEIDGVIYSTNSANFQAFYHHLFFKDIPKKEPKRKEEPTGPLPSLDDILRKDLRLYQSGFVPIYEDGASYWIKDPEKAKEIISKSKRLQKYIKSSFY